MLKSLHIENYRLFKQLDVPKLGRVNLITGKNNVGKTALLEAIRIYVSDGERSVVNNIIYNRGDWSNQLIVDDYSTLFNPDDISFENMKINEMNFVLNDTHLLLHYKNSDSRVVYKGENDYMHPREKAVLITTKIDQNNNKLWENITLTFKEDHVIDILRIIEPQLMQIYVDIGGDSTRVRLKHARKSIPLKNLGDGIKRLLTIAIGLVSAENSYLLIDEFDIGLHHSVQEKLWDIIFKVSKELNVQVFATTHSKDCIEAFTEVALKHEEEESQYFRLQRKRKGNDIMVIDYTTEDMEVAMAQHIETR